MIFTIFRPKRVKNGKPCVSRSYRGRYRLDGQDKIVDVSLYTTDKRVARQRLEEIVRDKQLEMVGVLPPENIRLASQSLLSKHLEDHVADLRTLGRTERHISAVEGCVGRLMRECQWTQIKDVTASSFLAWRASQKLAPKTLNEYLKAIRYFLGWMVKLERLERNPLRAVAFVKTNGEQVRPRRAFSAVEFARFLNVAGKHRVVYVTAVFTGLRRGELSCLLWSDIYLDVEKPFLKARAAITKNGKDAIIGLHEDVVPALRQLKQERRPGPDDLVFADLMPSMKIFRRQLKAANIPFLDSRGFRVDFHSLRHTLATNLALAGVSPRVAMEIMRHSDIRYTAKTYTDASLLPTFEAVAKLPSLGKAPVEDTQRASQDLPLACPDQRLPDHQGSSPIEMESVHNEQFESSENEPDQSSPDNGLNGGLQAGCREPA